MSVTSPAASPPDVGVIIAAAGSGIRASGGATGEGGRADPKQFWSVAGVPVLLRSIRPFSAHPAVAQIAVALPKAYATSPPPWLAELRGERLLIVAGGESRSESVLNALDALRGDCTVVVIHDAARPFVSRETVDRVIHVARSGAGAVAAVPVSDTIKEVEENRVVRTVPRDHLWRAQTPQAFPREVLARAYRESGLEPTAATDEARLCEAIGFPVTVVPDSPHNIKLTTADDFRIAEALARDGW
jgi:2-C-methyl-D-erythritol 4-phosphate cytidylyltransferase